MDVTQAENLLWYLNLAGTVALLVTMIRQRLRTKYPALFWYLAVDATQAMLGILLLGIGSRAGRQAYFYDYSAGQVLKLILALLVIREIAEGVLANRGALRVAARKLTAVVLSLAGILSALALWLTPPAVSASTGWQVAYFLAFERSVDLVMLLLLVSLTLFISWFPVQLSRNAAYYMGGYFSFFLTRWLGNNVYSLAPDYRQFINVAMMLGSALCLFGLALWLHQSGERAMVTPGHSWNPEAAERLRRQLDALNDSLASVRPVPQELSK